MNQSNEELDTQITELLRLINEADTIVSLTGAGISTEAGIPDFRSPGGLWSKYDPTELFSADGFRRHPETIYKMGAELQEGLRKSEPTKAHVLLRKLEELGKLKTVITQNVDNLHQRAGSTDVIELHGTLTRGTCLKCGKNFPHTYMDERIAEGELPPLCDNCQGLIKPDVVLFGDPLPVEALHRATLVAAEADLMLVLGSSLVVYPAAEIPSLTIQNGGKLVIINLQDTFYDRVATIVIKQKLGEVCDMLFDKARW